MWLYCSFIYDPAGMSCLEGSRRVFQQCQRGARDPTTGFAEQAHPQTSQHGTGHTGPVPRPLPDLLSQGKRCSGVILRSSMELSSTGQSHSLGLHVLRSGMGTSTLLVLPRPKQERKVKATMRVAFSRHSSTACSSEFQKYIPYVLFTHTYTKTNQLMIMPACIRPPKCLEPLSCRWGTGQPRLSWFFQLRGEGGTCPVARVDRNGCQDWKFH